MTDDYTPDTEEVREAYQISGDGADFKRRFFERGEDFDTWIRKVKAEAFNEGASAYGLSFWDGDAGVVTNPYES